MKEVVDQSATNILRFYTAVQSKLGFGDLHLRLDQGSLEIRLAWIPVGGIRRGEGYVEYVADLRLVSEGRLDPFRVAEDMRGRYAALVRT